MSTPRRWGVRPLAQVTKHTASSIEKFIAAWLADAYPDLAKACSFAWVDSRDSFGIVDEDGVIMDTPGDTLTGYVHAPSIDNNYNWSIEGLYS